MILFPEEAITDSDGNTIIRPSATGIAARASVQPIATTTDDQDATGNVTGPTRYRMRLTRSYSGPVLGRQSAVEWRGERWSVLGDPVVYEGSRRTAHTDYTIGRN